jgi:hypothetical protein
LERDEDSEEQEEEYQPLAKILVKRKSPENSKNCEQILKSKKPKIAELIDYSSDESETESEKEQ